ncbi:MAG: GIY-YIG nuclease family protein [Candidatus Omnitrophota bacterium]|nr:GIY-YIG nuclease family protein [Candidatus Omnitrophota bacterium]
MYVYVIQSKKNNRFYVGLTENVKLRFQQHNRGENRSTKAYRPWELVIKEEYTNKGVALKRERFLKTGKGREVIKNLLIKK